ncbi:MAG: hypothetical protein IT514_07235, partial [Burkholderiales bacterium]|nr:hypothetical protein [Burkholderiales bacterium]
AALAGECAALGLRPLVMDQSRGTVAARFGLRARYELAHVLRGDRDWSRVALDCGAGITLLPAKRGLPALAHEGWTATLLDWIYALPQRIDLVILNLASPQAAQGLIDPRGDWLVAIPGRNPNLIGAYRALKHLCGMARPASVRVLLEGHPHRRAAAACFPSLAAAARRFLSLELEDCGCLPGLDGEGGAARQLAAALEGWRLRDHAPARACGAGPQRERIPRGS